MHMVRHQDVGVNGATFSSRDLAEFAAVAQVIGIIEEARLPVVAALDDMLRDAGEVDAERAWHVVACALGGHRLIRHKCSRKQKAPQSSVGKVDSDPCFPVFRR